MNQNDPIQLHAVVQPPSGASLGRELIGLLFFSITYWFAVRLGLLLVAQPEGIASIWPVSGLALAILLLNPKSRWVKLLAVIFVTNVIGNWSGGNSLWVGLGYALVNTLEPVLAAWVLMYVCRSKITFERTAEIFALLFVATLINGLTALLGATVSMLAFQGSFINAWLVWWAADGLGIILVAPVIVSWATNKKVFPPSLQIIEMVLLVLIPTVFAWLLFGPVTVAEEPLLRNYMFFPLLIWLAFRFTLRGVDTTLLLVSVIAIWGTMRGYGIFSFADQTRTEHLVALQVFLIVLNFSGLFLSAMVTERKLVGMELQAALIREQKLARTDVLTNINNRRQLSELAEHEFEIATRYQQPLSVLLFDIDHFKSINDIFGHGVGDLVLQCVTDVACVELRSADVIGRYGGEEFVIVLPMTNAQQTYPLAERIRAGVEQICVPTEKGDATVTLSIGIVEMKLGAQNGSAENLIRNADEAMYTAKQLGRNRTVIFDSNITGTT
jgi:diguanylate cyclase (GGDEF)-like protein